MASKNIINKIILYFIGNFASRIISLLFIPLYAYVVSTSDLGSFDYVQTISGVIMPIVFLAIWEAVLKFIITENNNKEIIATINFYIICVINLVLVLYLMLLFYNGKKSFITNLFFIVISQGFTQIWQFYARALKKNKLYVKSSIIGSVVYVLLSFILLVLFNLGLTGLVLSFCVSQLVIFLILETDLKILSYGIKNRSLPLLKKILLFSSPLVINNISLWLFDGINKIIIVNFLGVSDNGLYSFANRFTIIISLLSSILSMSLIEEAYSYKSISEYSVNFSYIIQKISKMYFSLTLVAVPSIKLLYLLFFKNTDYFISSNFIFILLLISLFTALSNNFGSSFQITNKTNYIFLTTLSGSIISIIISILLVFPFGIFGTLIGRLVGTLAMMILRAIFAYRLTKLNIDWKSNLVLFNVIIASGILLNNSNITTLLLILPISSVFTILYNKNDIIKLLNYLMISFNSIKKTGEIK